MTNGTWNDFWINEGFTVYFENRIMEAVYGADYAAMLQALSHSDLTAEVADFMENAPNDSKLAIDLVPAATPMTASPPSPTTRASTSCA